MASQNASNMLSQEAVIATNDDATQSKRFAVQKGYWHDPYVLQMMGTSVQRRAPEISRGYYARVKAIQIMTEQFIKVIVLTKSM